MILENQELVNSLNNNLSILTIAGGAIAILWFLSLIYEWRTKKEITFLKKISKHMLLLGFLVSLTGTVISLYYSDYLGILPCGLCWLQRVFLYSQVFLFGLALKRGDNNIFGYSLLLSTVGIIIALYHHYLQMGYSELIPCPAIASTVNCDKPTFVEFGFVTFPLMGVVLFSILILISLHNWKRNK